MFAIKLTTVSEVRSGRHLDKRKYPAGKKIPEKEFAAINIAPNPWRGDWNYAIKPRTN